MPSKDFLSTHPILFVHAKQKYAKAYSYEWKERIDEDPNSLFVEYDCGHWIMIEEPDRLNEDMSTWLEKT